MEVYDLILEHGTINALKYANTIEEKNYKYASKIDDAVTKLLKQSQFTDPNDPRQISPGWSPKANTREYEVPQQNVQSPFNPSNIPLEQAGGSIAGEGIAGAAKIQAWRRGVQLMYNNQLSKFVTLLKQGNTIEAGRILQNAPRDFSTIIPGYQGEIRSKFIQAAQNVFKSNPEQYADFIHSVAGDFTQQSANTLFNRTKGMIGKMFTGTPSPTNKFIHPGAQGFNMVNASEMQGKQMGELEQLMAKKDLSTALNNGLVTADEYSLYAKEEPKVVEALLNSRGASQDFMVGFRNWAAKGGLQASEGLVQKAVPANVGKLEGMIAKLVGEGSKFSFLAPMLEMGAKVLGPFAVFLEGKGFFDEYEEYGFDGRTTCDFLSLLTGVGSLIPPLTAVAGPAWLLLSIGCHFVQHGEPLKKDDSTQATTTPTATQSTGIDAKDQQLYNQLYNQYKGDTDTLNAQFMEAVSGGKFDNPNAVLKALSHQLQGG